jgi:hypothetical protein
MPKKGKSRKQKVGKRKVASRGKSRKQVKVVASPLQGKVRRRAVHRETEAPYVKGSRTSRAAAESLSAEDLSRMEQRVFDCIRKAKLKGRTDEETERETGLRHQSASARRRKLVLRGRVRDSGFVRRNRSRRLAIVWEVGVDESASEGRSSGRPPRPSNQEMLDAAQEMRNNAQMGDEARKVSAWLVYVAKG